MSVIIIPKEKDIKVLVNDRKLSTLVSLEVQKENEFYPIKELLCGETDFVKTGENYILKLILSGEEELPDEFFIRVSTPTDIRTYTDCRVLLTRDKVASGDGFHREYTVKARNCNKREI